MQLDTLSHVEVNRVVEEHVRELAPQVVYTPAARRQPRPPGALRLGRGRHPTDTGAARAPPPHLRADLEHRVDTRPRSTGSCPTGTWTSPPRSSGRSPRSPTTRRSAATIPTRGASGRSGRPRSSTDELRVRARRAVRPGAQPRVFLGRALARLAAAADRSRSCSARPRPRSRSPSASSSSGARSPERKVDRVFSPVCECARDVAVISFVLRRRERSPSTCSTATAERVRTLVRDRDEPAGRVSYTWDGRDDLERDRRRGRLPPPGRARGARTHDRAPESDPRRHDRSSNSAPRRASAGVLARRGRSPRPDHRDGTRPTSWRGR